jgi:hypothetical protein
MENPQPMGANIKWKIPSLWEVMENTQHMGTAKPKENGANMASPTRPQPQTAYGANVTARIKWKMYCFR